MSLLNRMLGGGEERSRVDVAHPRDPVIASIFGWGTNTAAGVAVTPDTAMRLSAVYACVRLLSSAIASLPLEVYKRIADGGRERDTSHYLWPLLHDQPNRWQTSYEYREMQVAHLLLRGNAYAEIVGRRTAVDELVPLHPDRTTPFRAPDGEIAYHYQPLNGPARTLLRDEVHHVRGMSLDGLKGLSPIECVRESLGLTIAAEEFGARFFGNGTTIGGVLEHPNKLSDEAYKRLKQSWEERHQSAANAHKPAILEEGMKWSSLGIPPDQAQFLETRKFQIEEIARVYGVPPHMIGAVDKSTSWGSGIEQQGIGFVVYSLQPILARMEQAMWRDLLTTSGKKTHFVEFVVEGLLRGDTKARGEWYKTLFNLGAINSNEIRRRENMNPRPDGDTYYVQLNMGDTKKTDKEDKTDENGTSNGNA